MTRTITRQERSDIIDAVCRDGYGEPVYPHERELVSQMFDLMAVKAHIPVEEFDNEDNR